MNGVLALNVIFYSAELLLLDNGPQGMVVSHMMGIRFNTLRDMEVIFKV